MKATNSKDKLQEKNRLLVLGIAIASSESSRWATVTEIEFLSGLSRSTVNRVLKHGIEYGCIEKSKHGYMVKPECIISDDYIKAKIYYKQRRKSIFVTANMFLDLEENSEQSRNL